MRPLLIIAMEAEAAPVRDALGMDGPGSALHPAFPARIWTNERAALATNGIDPRFGVDSIASQPAITTALHAIEATEPDIVVSAGTAGGFAARGGVIGTTYLASRCLFHDRRVALPGFDRYGDGDYPVADLGEVAARAGFELGPVSTGNALDAPAGDLQRMNATDTVAKDMEAAAVAWTCERLGVPFTALKVVTDLVDHPEETAEQFVRNLEHATARLAAACVRLVGELNSLEGLGWGEAGPDDDERSQR